MGLYRDGACMFAVVLFLTIGTAVKSKCQAGILTVYYSSASNPSQNET